MTNNDPRQPTLRITPGPSDINSNGHIFGGWVLSQMDLGAWIQARKLTSHRVVTVAIDNNPVLIAAAKERDATRYDVGVARASRLPQISATGGASYTNYLGSASTTGSPEIAARNRPVFCRASSASSLSGPGT